MIDELIFEKTSQLNGIMKSELLNKFNDKIAVLGRKMLLIFN